MNGLSEGALGLLALGLLDIYIYVICYVIRCKKMSVHNSAANYAAYASNGNRAQWIILQLLDYAL